MAEKQRLVALNVRRFHEHLYKVLNHEERRLFVQVFNKFQKKRNVASLVTDLRTLLDNSEKEEIVLHLLNVLRPNEKEQFFKLWMRTSAFEALYKANVSNGDEYISQEDLSPYRNDQYRDNDIDYHGLELRSNTSSVNHRNNLSTDSDYDSPNGFQIMGRNNQRPIQNNTTNNRRKNRDNNRNILSPGKSRSLPTKRKNRIDNDDMRLSRNSVLSDKQFNGIPSKQLEPISGLKLPSKTVLLKRARDVGFGFSIRGGKEHGIGIYISAVLTDSPASQAGLRKGDLLLKVNGIGFQKVSHSVAVQVIKDSRKLKMNVYSYGYIPGSRVAQVEYKWVDIDGRPVSPLANFKNEVDNQKSDMMLLRHDDERKVNVFTEVNSKLGIYIRGGNEFGLGIFIAGIDRGSVAEKSGIKTGDQILNVNGIDFGNISHDDAVKALKRSKMMTLILHDVGKIPYARLLYDKTEWLDEENNKQTVEKSQNQLRPNSQDEVLNSMFRQGIAGSQLLHHTAVGVSAEALIQENARIVLNEEEMRTLKYYLNEYTQDNIDIHGLILSLTELFDTPEKSSLFAEIRNIIQPQDIHIFDESVMTKESSAVRRSSSPYKSSFGLRSPAPFVPEFLAPDSSSSQGYDGTESDSSTHYHQPVRSNSSLKRHQHYTNYESKPEVLPTSAIGETDSELNDESNSEVNHHDIITEESNWYQREIQKRNNQVKHLNNETEQLNQRTNHTDNFYGRSNEDSYDNNHHGLESSSPTGDDSLTSDINEEYGHWDSTGEPSGHNPSPKFPRVITRSHVLQDVEEDMSLGISSLSSTANSEHGDDNNEDYHVVSTAINTHALEHPFYSEPTDVTPHLENSVNESLQTPTRLSENTLSTSNDPMRIFQFNLTPREPSPVFQQSQNLSSPLSPSESRLRTGSLVKNVVKTFDSETHTPRSHSSSIVMPKSPLFTSAERPPPLQNREDNEQSPDRSNTSSPDIIVPSDAWRHHHRKISKTRSHSVSGEHPRIQVNAPQRKGKSVFHNAYLNSPQRYGGSTESLNRLNRSPRVSLGSRTGHYQSENDLGYHNDQFSVSVASRVQLLQEKNNDISSGGRRAAKLSLGSRTQSVDELALRNNNISSPGPSSSRSWLPAYEEEKLTRAKSLSDSSINESYDFRAHELSLDRIENARQEQMYSAVSLDSLLNADYDAPIDKSLGTSGNHLQNFNFMKSMPSSIDGSRNTISSPNHSVGSPEMVQEEDGPTIGSVLSLAKIFESRSDTKTKEHSSEEKRSSRFNFNKFYVNDSQMSSRKVSHEETLNDGEFPNPPEEFTRSESPRGRTVSIDKSYSKHGLSIRESKDLNGVEIATIDDDSESAAFHNKDIEIGQIITGVDSESLKGLNASLAMLVLNRAFIYKDGHFMELKILDA